MSQRQILRLNDLVDGQPVRTCVVCRQRRLMNELYRLALVQGLGGTKKVVFDWRHILPGRGAWVCRDNLECLAKLPIKSRINRAFKETDLDLTEIVDSEKTIIPRTGG